MEINSAFQGHPSPSPVANGSITDGRQRSLSPEKKENIAPGLPLFGKGIPSRPSQNARGADSPANGEVTDDEINLLTAIWKDDDLGLYGTKWPVPTYLAHQAAHRAMTHLHTDDWDRPKETTTPYYLPEVHENVRNSLYYL